MKSKEFFNKTKGIKTLKDKYDYINKHFYYFTMNSWNRTTSIANNIKAYNLPLSREQRNKFFEILADESLNNEFYADINSIINDYIENEKVKYNNIDVFFNGRNGGYLVLTPANSNKNIINELITDFDNYNEALQDLKGWRSTHKEAQAELKEAILNDFEVVKSFDVFCDELLSQTIYILDNAKIESIEYYKKEVQKTLIY